jgi:hypothetical protein
MMELFYEIVKYGALVVVGVEIVVVGRALYMLALEKSRPAASAAPATEE